MAARAVGDARQHPEPYPLGLGTEPVGVASRIGGPHVIAADVGRETVKALNVAPGSRCARAREAAVLLSEGRFEAIAGRLLDLCARRAVSPARPDFTPSARIRRLACRAERAS
jgi:hypothetical protein